MPKKYHGTTKYYKHLKSLSSTTKTWIIYWVQGIYSFMNKQDENAYTQ